jgi:hypothetical protein
MKSIHTLIPDIYAMVGKEEGWFNEPIAQGFSRELGLKLIQNLKPKDTVPSLRLSQMGPRCPRALWASIHSPGSSEVLPPWVRIKFSYGHILEALVIAMAKGAGHDVVGEQDELVVDGIVGHRDCVIDGCIVDVKSASSYSFQKFKDGSIGENDTFGYLDQLDGYLVGSLNDPLVTVKDRGYLLAIDKTLGHMCLYEHRLNEKRIRDRIREYKGIVGLSTPPACTCCSVPDGKSGNLKLDVAASYSMYKHFCNPGLRTFLYTDGPRYLTRVVRKPDVVEIDKHGKVVYN